MLCLAFCSEIAGYRHSTLVRDKAEKRCAGFLQEFTSISRSLQLLG